MRELANVVARYVLTGPESLTPQEPPRKRGLVPAGASLETGTISLKRMTKNVIREMERTVIVEALRANQWNRRKTAQALKISYRALIYKIREAGLGQRNVTSTA